MFKAQKALHLYTELEKKKTTIEHDIFMIFEKMDGWWGAKRVSESLDFAELIASRSGRFIPSLLDLSESVAAFERIKQINLKGTLIFEILVEGVPVFKDLNGILNRSKAPCQAEGAYIMVHDFIPDGEQVQARQRYSMAEAYVEALGHRMVRLAPMLATGDHEAVQTYAEGIWKRGGEGSIGKRIDAYYSEGKRNKDIIKVKCEVTVENVVIGIEQGAGKYVGTLGALLVQSKAGVVNKVSGMSDDERYAWYTDSSLIIGKVVEIDAMQILENGSFREGRFKAVRHDKTVAEID